jgi:alpha-tubulin suppressor-like RCC1 family protein
MTPTARRISRPWFAAAALGVLVLSVGFVKVYAGADQNEGITPASAVAQGHIAVGGLHTCAVLTDAHVQCWGSNDQGQLGNGTVTTSTAPSTVPGIGAAVAITAGNTHTCVLLTDTTVRCWGLDGNGQLGDGTTGDPANKQQRRSPVTVSGLTGATAIAAGGFHTCAIVTGGTVKCWGDDGMGQLGDGKPGDKSLTAATVPGLSNVTAVSAGEFHTCALLSDGTVKCWGHNGFGQLGDGTTTPRATPVAVAGLPDPGGPTANPVLALTTGYGHTCALLKDNTARCWGENNFGQLGYPTPKNSSGVMQPSLTPKAVRHNNTPVSPPGLPQPPDDLVDQAGMIAISAGQFHTCALVSGGSARCWGNGARGQLGTDPNPYSANAGEIEDSTTTVDVVGLGGAASAITAGGFDTCAVVGSGMRCWGYNFYGQLGSSASGSPVPVQVTAVTGATTVSAGTGFACALVNAETQHKPVCWGDNRQGQLGAGLAVADTTIRTPVVGVTSADALDAGNGHACALPAGTQSPQCWGFNATGQLGNGSTTSSSSPVPVSGLTNATSISAGGAFSSPSSTERGHSCSVTADNKVSCWGRNGNGQLGVANPDGSLADHSAPVVVQYDSDPLPPEPGNDHVTLADLTGAAAVTTGGFHSCALASDTTVWCWGANGSGQLGDNTTTDRHHGVHVQKDDSDPSHDNPLTGVVALAAGAGHTCALLNDASMKCWGDDAHGQLGDGASASSSTPVDVSGIDGSDNDHKATVITAGDDHTCAVLANGALVCWGTNADGQLGDGSTTDRATPTAVHNMGPTPNAVPAQFRPIIKSISASRHNTCAVLIDTTVYCWGDNANDQLGDGIGATSVSPRTVTLAGSL